jgi:ADP-ribosylglycohydrolase
MLLGSAIGDALGMPVEGVDYKKTRRAIYRLGNVRHFIAPQNHVLRSLRHLRAGCWTDETQINLELTRSIVNYGALDYDGLAEALVRAFETVELRGWDSTTKQGCRRLAQGTHRLRSGKLGGNGNAVAARIPTVAAWSFAQGDSREQLLEHCFNLGMATHNDVRAITGAYIIALIICDALANTRKWNPSEDRYHELIEEAKWAEHQLSMKLGPAEDNLSRHLEELSDALDSGSKELAEFCNGAGEYVCDSVSYIAVLLHGQAWDFESGVLAAINGGGDTDTHGAIAGAILGAAYGVRKIPKGLISKLEEAEIIRTMGGRLANVLVPNDEAIAS